MPAFGVPLDTGVEPVEAPVSQPVPVELSSMVEQMDQAANAQRLKTFMRFFSDGFAHQDGLNRKQMKQSVRSFWKQFDQLSYATQIESWNALGAGVYETVTLTTITGTQNEGVPGTRTLNATVRSRQTIDSAEILAQRVLDESSQIVSGDNPPTVSVNLPKTVKAGDDYFFDVIVDEPLGDRILLGAAIEESVTPQTYLSASKFEIQSLATGGLFKIGQAPSVPSDQWISALLIQEGGMYMMSQRVTVLPAVETASK